MERAKKPAPSLDPAAFLEAAPRVCGFIEEGNPVSEDQFTALIDIYGRADLDPAARNYLEAMLGRTSFGPHAERLKKEGADRLLPYLSKPLSETDADKLANIFR